MSDERDGPEGPDGPEAIFRAEATLAALLGVPVDALRDPSRSGPALADALTDAGRWLRDALLGDADDRQEAAVRWSRLRERLDEAGLDTDDLPDDLGARIRQNVPADETIEALRQSAARSEEAAVQLSILGMRAGEWLKTGAEQLRSWADRMSDAQRPRRPDLRVVPGGREAQADEGEDEPSSD